MERSFIWYLNYPKQFVWRKTVIFELFYKYTFVNLTRLNLDIYNINYTTETRGYDKKPY